MSPYLEQIMEKLNMVLEREGRQRVPLDAVMFAMDADMDFGRHGESRKIMKSALISPYQFDDLVAPLFEEGPSWIHMNVIPTEDQHFLITITMGRLVGNPSPSINVSHELHRVVKIMD